MGIALHWCNLVQVQKLVHVEDALASNCTCMLCLEVLKQPLTCVPGGHTYCKVCVVHAHCLFGRGWDISKMRVSGQSRTWSSVATIQTTSNRSGTCLVALLNIEDQELASCCSGFGANYW